MRFVIVLVALLTGMLPQVSAQQKSAAKQSADFKVVTVVRNLHHPWSLAFLPDSGFLITERRGRMLLFKNDGVTQVVKGLPAIRAERESGLLDVVIDPDFRKNRTIYFAYTANDKGRLMGTEIASAVLDGSTLRNLKVIFRAEPKTSDLTHFGSRFLFADDGTLLITIGDHGQYPNPVRSHNAQNPSNTIGTIIRLKRDGTIPKDNPFVGKRGYRPEIYTYGNRNPQGIARDPETGRIWFHEHGPKGGDELNILKAGANYGWPTVTHGINYDGTIITNRTTAPGIEPPVTYWTPAIAPSGMMIYDGNAFPEWKGDMFIGSLVERHLRRIVLQGNRVTGQQVLLNGLGERIRDVRTGPDGRIYILTDSPNGRLLRLEPR
ncbi:hypothetical protein CHL67_10490 [Prosthecochloris sp. GSB1]|uniref:PQQ-dependent sugar dehydrogenase n=1 Tax=Prosthecochloris sp. GSB1 TaxID=281093 RepID=UPI000B8CDDE6|nr:PQQ-dependent sugar dehydrogenase [Prosthecochloris sp. GSB1]ASQ91782.1 hypothetical protein CHL67_10490 [Prosthecochloris sp. GSB1]